MCQLMLLWLKLFYQAWQIGTQAWEPNFRSAWRDNHALGTTLDRYSICLALAGTFLVKRICGEIFFLYLKPYYKKTPFDLVWSLFMNMSAE